MMKIYGDYAESADITFVMEDTTNDADECISTEDETSSFASVRNFTSLSHQELKAVWNVNSKLRDIVRDDAENYAMSNIQEYMDIASMWSALRNAEYSIYYGMQCGGIKDYRDFADACLKLQQTFEFFGTRYSEKFWKKIERVCPNYDDWSWQDDLSYRCSVIENICEDLLDDFKHICNEELRWYQSEENLYDYFVNCWMDCPTEDIEAWEVDGYDVIHHTYMVDETFD